MKPGFDDLGDPAVDDRAGVHDDARVALDRSPLALAVSADQAHRLGGDQQVASFGDRQADHPETQEDRHAQRQPACPNGGARPDSGKPSSSPIKQAEQQAGDGGHELRGRQRLDLADQPAGRHYGQVREDREPDDEPGDDPGGQQGARVVAPAKESFAGVPR